MAQRWMGFLLKGSILAFAVVFFWNDSAYAATISVDTTALSGTASECTLADALQAADGNTVVNGCAAGSAMPTIDTISLPAGTFDILNNYYIVPAESVVISGVGAGQTILNGTLVGPLSLTPADKSFRMQNLTLSNSQIYSDGGMAVVTFDHIVLDAVSVSVSQYSEPVTTTLSNIRAINGTSLDITSIIENPASTYVQNAEFDGGGTTGLAITHFNPYADATLYIANTLITGYRTGIYNQECTSGAGVIHTVRVTNSVIGGGGMNTGIVNLCGHAVIDKTTFTDIEGAAILASANYQTVNMNDYGGGNISYDCQEQSGSFIEITNSTFTGINVIGTYEQPLSHTSVPTPNILFKGVVTIDANLNPDCSGATKVTTSDLTLLHNTFAGNTYTNPNSADLSVTDGTTLRMFRVRNNAFQSSGLSGSFTASGSVRVVSNFIINAYTGPSVFGSGFTRVDDFFLGPLQDDGGAGVGVDQLAARVLTMRPLAESPLIDAALSAGLTVDQRSVSRSLMNRYDAGAVEVTLAEFTADGGVFVPEEETPVDTDEPGKLAETGTDMTFYAVGASSLLGAGIYLLRKR